MKKLSAILLVAVMVLACVACGNSKNSGVEVKDATEILTKTREEYNNSPSE